MPMLFQLRRLNLSDNNITVKGVQTLVEYLDQQSTVQQLDLSNNPLGDDGVLALQPLRSPPLEDLLVNNVGMTVVGGYDMVEFDSVRIEARGHFFSAAVLLRFDYAGYFGPRISCDRPPIEDMGEVETCERCTQVYDEYVACDCGLCL